MLETTREKVARLFKPDALKKLQDAGLMVIDKQDFDLVMDGYNEWTRLKRGGMARDVGTRRADCTRDR